MRQWMALLEKEGELRRITAEVDWDREIGAIARRVLEKKGPALLFENIKGYRSGRCTKLFAERSGRPLAPGPGPRLPARRLQSRAGAARDEEEPRDDRAGRRQDGPGQGRRRARRRRRPDGVPRPQVALPGGRALHPHLLRHRHPRSRDARDERGHLPRDDRPEGHGALPPHQGRPALGRPLREVGGAQGAHAGGLRDRLGPDHAVPGRARPFPPACASGTSWAPIAASPRSWCAARRWTWRSRPPPRSSSRGTSATIRPPTSWRGPSASSPATSPTSPRRGRP